MILIKKDNVLLTLKPGQEIILSYEELYIDGHESLNFRSFNLAEKAFKEIIRKISFEKNHNCLIDLDVIK